MRILVEGDYHCGHVLGLTPPDWWSKQNRRFASAMWNWREKMLAEVGPVDVHVLNGDLTDGEGRKGTIGLIVTDIAMQAEMAAMAAKRVNAKERFLTYGTPFHTVSTLSHEQLVADELDAPITDTLRLKAGGLRFNFRHVVGRSDVPYGQGTQLFKEAVRDALQSLIHKTADADVFVRSHVHYFWHEESATKHALICPAWELPMCDEDGNNVYPRTLRTMYYDVGALVLDVEGGELTVRKQIMPLRYVAKREYIECGIQ